MPFYPTVLVAAFLLAAFFDADVSPYAALRVFAVALVATAILTAVCVFLLGSLWGGLVSIVIVLMARAGDPIHVIAAAVLIPASAAAWLLCRRLWPDAELLRRPIAALNLLASLLLAVTVGAAILDGSIGRMELRVPASPSSLITDSDRGGAHPDIYLILLDGYPREDTLSRLFHYDNSPFSDGLRAEGFDISDTASSNYMYTDLTLSSMFHMRYLEDIPDRREVRVPFGVSLRWAINHNPVWDDLRSRGYVIAASKAPWEEVGLRSADVFCGEAPNNFELFLVRTTLIGRLVTAIDQDFEADAHRASVNEAFDCLDRMDEPTTQPKLVVVHVGGPHLPVVFAADGDAASRDVFGHTAEDPTASAVDFQHAYVEQLKYLNSKLTEALEPLTTRPDRPIVIVMSDHGSELRLDWGNGLNSDMQERFGNFFAARTPGRPSLFPQDVTPIELFPTLLNAYLETQWPVPPPRFFASAAQDKLSVAEIQRP